MKEARFRLTIAARDYLAYYQGAVSHVQVTAHDGAQVRFSASLLRPYVTRSGVYGEFVLRYDDQHRLIGLERTGP